MIRMEFLDATGDGKYPDASPKTLVRLSEFTEDDQEQLMAAIKDLLFNVEKSVDLDRSPFIMPVNCFVSLRVVAHDEGLVKLENSNQFECRLTLAAYQDMIEVIKLIGGGHNWLTPGEYLDDPAFLLSRYSPW